MQKIKCRFHRELDREPTEDERLQNANNRTSIKRLAITAFMVTIIGLVYLMAQPVSFTGEIVLSGGVGGNIISNTTLSNYSESFNNTNSYTDINATIDNMNGEIRINGNYEMPMYAFYKMSNYFME